MHRTRRFFTVEILVLCCDRRGTSHPSKEKCQREREVEREGWRDTHTHSDTDALRSGGRAGEVLSRAPRQG